MSKFLLTTDEQGNFTIFRPRKCHDFQYTNWAKSLCLGWTAAENFDSRGLEEGSKASWRQYSSTCAVFVQQMDRSCSEHANVLASFLSTILRFVKGKVGGASKDESRGKTKSRFPYGMQQTYVSQYCSRYCRKRIKERSSPGILPD